MVAYVTAVLSGGLGNQLFQIAVGYALALDLGVEFKISRRNFFGAAQGRGPENYSTTVFSSLDFTEDPIYTDDAVVWEQSWTYESIRGHVEAMIRNHGYACIQGYYQSDLYFRDHKAAIRGLFTPGGSSGSSDSSGGSGSSGYATWLRRHKPAIAEMYRELLEDNSYCFIGVRRGDYLSPINRLKHNPCDQTYYRAAMTRMPSERYYIASDDIEWCRQTFVGPQFRFFELGLEEDEAQLALMTLFRRYIISNSTFYWWGSYLSRYEDSTVIAPDKWIFGPAVRFPEYYSIYRDDMTVLERPIEY